MNAERFAIPGVGGLIIKNIDTIKKYVSFHSRGLNPPPLGGIRFEP